MYLSDNFFFGSKMKTRRETTSSGGNSNSVLVPVMTTTNGEEQLALPAQQQRAIAQLKSVMASLNKRHGTGTTNEILSQIVQSLNLEEPSSSSISGYKPEYSDVPVDSQLSVPPLPSFLQADKSIKSSPKIGPVPNWFSFDAVSELESAHFGPLFSMDEERWKMYLSLRNDVVRIYEDMIAPIANKGEVFLTSADIRSRLHPKDDAAYVFEIWKFLSALKVINRGRTRTDVISVASGSGIMARTSVPVPPQRPNRCFSSTGFSKIKCSSCKRECQFFCYKPLAPPPVPLGESNGKEEEEEDDEELMEEMIKTDDPPVATPLEESAQEYMCHDCTPAYFEKVPLRLFIDKETRGRIIRGEFEEVGKDDLKSFLVVQGDQDEQEEEEKQDEFFWGEQNFFNLLLLQPSTSWNLVKSWDSYSHQFNLSSESKSYSEKPLVNNPLEILDPQMQEALSGAGQKIRGSVLIEQQVRNMVYQNANNTLKKEDVDVTCPTSIERAWTLIEQVFSHVIKNSNRELPREISESAVFVHAKKTDPVHFQLLSLVYRVSEAAMLSKEEILLKFQSDKLISLAEERIEMKRQFVEFLKQLSHPQEVQQVLLNSVSPTPSDIFVPVKIDSSVKLASLNPKQLRLINL